MNLEMANPKSANLGIPFENKIFAGLMSRCIIPKEIIICKIHFFESS